MTYLLASSVRPSFAFALPKIAKVGRVYVAWTPDPNSGFPTRRDIPAQRNHPVAGNLMGYVIVEFIGDEGVGLLFLILVRKRVNCILTFP